MATQLTKKVRRGIDTKRGARVVEFTPHGVVVREPGKRSTPAPVPYEMIEDLGWKIEAGYQQDAPARTRRKRAHA